LRNEFGEFIIHTDQYYDYWVNDIFFSELDIPNPHINLGEWQIGRMLEKIIKMTNCSEPTGKQRSVFGKGSAS